MWASSQKNWRALIVCFINLFIIKFVLFCMDYTPVTIIFMVSCYINFQVSQFHKIYITNCALVNLQVSRWVSRWSLSSTDLYVWGTKHQQQWYQHVGRGCEQAKRGQSRLHKSYHGSDCGNICKMWGSSKLHLLCIKSNNELQFFPRVKVFNQINVLSLLRQAERKINKLIF